MTTAERSVLFGVSAMLLGSWVAIARPANVARKPALAPSHRVQTHAPPSASTGVDIPVQGSVKDAAGRVYTASATVHVEISEPAPLPPPGPSILRVESAGGAGIVSAATGGVPLELVGTGFPLSGIRRLTVAGQIAVVTQWTATRVFFTLPNVREPVTGPIEVWVQPVTTWASLVRGPTFTITPRPVPPPPPPPASGLLPVVDQVLAAGGTARETVTAGDPITLVGRRFGQAMGELFVCGFPVQPLSWNDTRIVFAFKGVNRAHRIWAIIVRADGGSATVGGGSESRPQLPFVVAGSE